MTVERRNDLITFLVFVSCPILALPLILYGLWNNHKNALGFFILFLCLLAYLFPPTGDLFRYYDLYYKHFAGLSYRDIFDFYIFDFSWYSLLYVLANYNFSFQVSQLISCFIQSMIIVYILRLLNPAGYKNKHYFYIVVGSLIYDGFWIGIELRFYVALYIFLLAIVEINFKRYIIAVLMLIIASLTHLSFIVFSFIILMIKVFQRIITLKTTIIVSITAFLIISSIGAYLESQGFSKAVYITTRSDWTNEQSLFLQLMRNWFMFIPGLYLTFIMLRQEKRNYLNTCSLIFTGLLIATLPMGDLNTRFKYIAFALSWVCFISIYPRVSINQIKRFFILSILAFICCSAIYNKSLRRGYYEKLCQPIPITLIEEGYTDDWIQSHITDGSID